MRTRPSLILHGAPCLYPVCTDVARLAGVSQKTVSRVFNDEPGGSPRKPGTGCSRRHGNSVTRPERRRACPADRTYLPHRRGVARRPAYFGQSDLLVALEQAARGQQLHAQANRQHLRGRSERVRGGRRAICSRKEWTRSSCPSRSTIAASRWRSGTCLVLMLGTASGRCAPPVVLSVHASEGGEAARRGDTVFARAWATPPCITSAGPRRWWGGFVERAEELAGGAGGGGRRGTRADRG